MISSLTLFYFVILANFYVMKEIKLGTTYQLSRRQHRLLLISILGPLKRYDLSFQEPSHRPIIGVLKLFTYIINEILLVDRLRLDNLHCMQTAQQHMEALCITTFQIADPLGCLCFPPLGSNYSIRGCSSQVPGHLPTIVYDSCPGPWVCTVLKKEQNQQPLLGVNLPFMEYRS